MSADDWIFTVLGTVGLVVAVMWMIGEYRIKKETKRQRAEAAFNSKLSAEQSIIRHAMRKGRADLEDVGEIVLDAMPEDRDLDRRYASDYGGRSLYVAPVHNSLDNPSCRDYSPSSYSGGSQQPHSSPSSSSKGCFGASGASDGGSSGGSSGDSGGGGGE